MAKKRKVHSLTGRITFPSVHAAWRRVRRNRGAAGIDKVSIKMFEANLEENLQFIEQHLSGIFIGPTGTGKSHLLTALGYTACEKGICVRYTRVVDMINLLTTAQINGTLEKALKAYVNPSLLLLDELGYPTGPGVRQSLADT